MSESIDATMGAPTSGGTRRALGAVILTGSNAIRLVVQLAMLPVLARLVGPAEYGLVALAVPLVLFCNMLSDGGLGHALARRRDVTPELESTVFWYAGAIGVALALTACALAWPAAALLREPRLAMLVVALSPVLAMSGFTAAANARVIREGRFGIFAIGDLISVTLSSAAALSAALAGWGAWSLVAQQLVLWGCKFVWVGSRAGVQVRRVFRPSLAGDLLRFGRDTIGSNIADFVTRNAGNVIIGGALGSLTLGWYAMAYQIARIPDLLISGPVGLFVFTAVGHVAERGREALRILSLSTLRLAITVLAPVFCGLALVSDLAVEVVLGAKWAPAAPVLSALCAAGLAFSVCSVIASMFMGLGRSSLQLRLSAAAGVATVAVVALSVHQGLQFVAWALALVTVSLGLAYVAVLAKVLDLPRLRLAACGIPAAAGAAAMTVALLSLRPLLAGLPSYLQLVLLVAVGGGAYLAPVLLVWAKLLRSDLRSCLAAHGDAG